MLSLADHLILSAELFKNCKGVLSVCLIPAYMVLWRSLKQRRSIQIYQGSPKKAVFSSHRSRINLFKCYFSDSHTSFIHLTYCFFFRSVPLSGLAASTCWEKQRNIVKTRNAAAHMKQTPFSTHTSKWSTWQTWEIKNENIIKVFQNWCIHMLSFCF